MLEYYFGHRNIKSGHLDHFTLRKPILDPQMPKELQVSLALVLGSKSVVEGGERPQTTRNDISMPIIILKHTCLNSEKTLRYFVWSFLTKKCLFHSVFPKKQSITSFWPFLAIFRGGLLNFPCTLSTTF